MKGSLQNTTITRDGVKYEGFIFSLMNPPVPLGGNIVSIDVYVDEIPQQRGATYVATNEDMVSAEVVSDDRPLSFRPFQTARFLVIRDGGLDETKRHTIAIMSKMQGFEQVVIPFRFSDNITRRRGLVIIEGNGHDTAPGDEATNFENFNSPLVLSGKKAYVICSTNGAISANWSWMGVRYDNGGLYVPPVRVFGKSVVEISMNEGVRRRLPNFVVSSKHENGVLETRHEMAGLAVRRRLAVPFNSRGFIMTLDMSVPGDKPIERPKRKKSEPTGRKVRVHFMIDGNITSYGLAAVSHDHITKFNRRHNCLQISSVPQKGADMKYFGTIGIAPSNARPQRVVTDAFDNDLEISYDFHIRNGENVQLALIGTGGLTSKEECLRDFLLMRKHYAALMESTEKSFALYLASTVGLTTTSHDDALLNKVILAFEKTKTCLRYLKAHYDGLGQGISAGLPRFPNYWARDTGWTLRGYLAIGDYSFAAVTIDNFLKHQAKQYTKGALKGELPMIISGKAFLHSTTFGSADSTFLFPPAILKYVQSTGDVAYLKARWDAIRELIDWGFMKDIDGDGLVENDFTGVAEKMTIQDSTWMDHIDRRKSANDIQALFYGSLVSGAKLAELAGDSESAQRWRSASAQLQEKIDSSYWNESSGFFYDTIRKDGSKDKSIRPNALVLLLCDAVKDRAKAEAVLSRIEKSDMTTPWGVRTLSATDPAYRPTLYHDGAVWPLVTGWAALCEAKYGRKEQALKYLSSMADRIIAENGMYAETYRGDRPEPFNSCILQAWSAGMYAWAFTEIMAGISLDVVNGRVQIDPQLPESIKNGSPKVISIDHPIVMRGGTSRLMADIDHANKKISVNIRGRFRPEISSSSYNLHVIN